MVGVIKEQPATPLKNTMFQAQGAEIVGYCELIKHPDRYNGKTVTVKATYGSGMEFSVFFDDECGKSTPNEDVIALATFSENARSNSLLYKKLRKVLKKSDEAQMTVVAKFTDGKSRVFGHQMCCRFCLEVLEILAVEEKKLSPPRR